MSRLPYRMVVCILRIIFFLFFRVRTSGKENIPPEGPAILCSNHISWWDPPFLTVVTPRPIHFMAKRELFDIPIFGPFLASLLAFPVKRGGGDRRAVRQALGILEGDEVVGMFPEGTRRRGNQEARFLRGAAYLAQVSGAPLIPMGISGRYGFVSRLRMVIGEPIVPRSIEGDRAERNREIDRLTEELARRIGDLSNGET